MKHEPFRIGAQTTRHADVQTKKPPARALTRLKKLDATTLAKLLGMHVRFSE